MALVEQFGGVQDGDDGPLRVTVAVEGEGMWVSSSADSRAPSPENSPRPAELILRASAKVDLTTNAEEVMGGMCIL